MINKLVLENSTALLRDDFVPFKDANLSIASSPMLYGLCVYSTFAVTWNEPKQQLFAFRMRDHYERIVRSCRIMGFKDYSQLHSYEKFAELMLELLRKNNVREDALVRVMVFIDEIAAGARITGLNIAFTAFVYPMGEILSLAGVHACVSSWVRNNDNMIPPRAKVNGAYVNSALMKNEAILNGYDEAIALDSHGHVAEASVMNLFLVRNGKLLTPHAQADILEGITRNTILHLARKLNIGIEERNVDRTELYIADEAMFVGSSARITPILSIDKRIVGDGKVGSLTTKLADAYAKLQSGDGKDDENWLTAVYS